MKTITAIAFALSLGLIASAASAHEKASHDQSADQIPVYTTING